MTNATVFPVAVAAACGLLIPGVVDLLTKSHLRDGVKAALAAVLSAVAGAITTTTLSAGESWQTYLLAVLTAFAVTMGSHATGWSGATVEQWTANLGIGAQPVPADPLSATQPAEPDRPGVIPPTESGG